MFGSRVAAGETGDGATAHGMTKHLCRGYHSAKDALWLLQDGG